MLEQMESESSAQIPEKVIYVSLRSNALRKGMNQFLCVRVVYYELIILKVSILLYQGKEKIHGEIKS